MLTELDSIGKIKIYFFPNSASDTQDALTPQRSSVQITNYKNIMFSWNNWPEFTRQTAILVAPFINSADNTFDRKEH